MIHIGIDIGVNTGFAVSENKKLTHVASYTILDAMEKVLEQDGAIVLHIEDPTQNTYVARSTRAEIGRLQGAGSVKRDFKIWMEFVEKHGIKHVLHSHRRTKKLNSEQFKRLTGWASRTNQHGRDAAYLVWGR